MTQGNSAVTETSLLVKKKKKKKERNKETQPCPFLHLWDYGTLFLLNNSLRKASFEKTSLGTVAHPYRTFYRMIGSPPSCLMFRRGCGGGRLLRAYLHNALGRTEHPCEM